MEFKAIRRGLATLLSWALAGCAGGTGATDAAPFQVRQDVEGYAMASCLSSQPDPYLRDQGDAWASAILQRSHGSLTVFTAVAEAVIRQMERGAPAVVRDESTRRQDRTLPLLYCYELVDEPALRNSLQEAIAALRASYPRQSDP